MQGLNFNGLLICARTQIPIISFSVYSSDLDGAELRSKFVIKSKYQCISSRMTTVIDIDKTYAPTLESHSTSSAVSRALDYMGAIGSPVKIDYEAIWPTENIYTNEEATIAATAAEALAIAKAAVEVAKDAAQLIRKAPPIKMEKSDKTEKFPYFNESELLDLTIDSSKDKNENQGVKIIPDQSNDVLIEELKDYEGIAVRSKKQRERRAKRAKASEKAVNSIMSLKSGSSTKKKRNAVQEIDYSDPLRYLRGTTSTSKLLTASEELELSEGIQDLIKLESLQEELTERNGSRPTAVQWAKAAGVDLKTLRKRIDYGRYCKDRMIKSNIRLVISIAKNFQGAGMNLQDLVQEGCRGLVKGAEKFDASKGFKFSTYAHWWIKQAVRKSLSDQSRTIRLPFHMVEATYRVREARKQLYSENGRFPDDEQVAEATGLTMRRVTAVNLAPKAPRSLEQKIGINQTMKASEVIADPDALTTEEIFVKKLMKQDLSKVLDSLNPREKQVIQWRFGIEDGRMKTLQEIGELMGVSRERVRQIESCAFRKLKNKKRTKNLQQYVLS